MSNIRALGERELAQLLTIAAPAPEAQRDPTWIEWDALIAAAPETDWRKRQAAARAGARRRRERLFGVVGSAEAH